ncbi:MAG: hypothetical protein O3B96_00815, partial [bacterium]|nr:hypothetical protein [bacterium]
GEKNALITIFVDNNGRVPLEIEEWRFPLDCDDEYGSIDYDFVVDGEVVVVGSIASCAPKGVTIYERVEVPTGGSVTVSLVVAPAIDARFTQVAVNFDPAYGLLAYHGTHRIGPPDVLPKFAIRASPHTVY